MQRPGTLHLPLECAQKRLCASLGWLQRAMFRRAAPTGCVINCAGAERLRISAAEDAEEHRQHRGVPTRRVERQLWRRAPRPRAQPRRRRPPQVVRPRARSAAGARSKLGPRDLSTELGDLWKKAKLLAEMPRLACYRYRGRFWQVTCPSSRVSRPPYAEMSELACYHIVWGHF
jgi:hypothetical protein